LTIFGAEVAKVVPQLCGGKSPEAEYIQDILRPWMLLSCLGWHVCTTLQGGLEQYLWSGLPFLRREFVATTKESHESASSGNSRVLERKL